MPVRLAWALLRLGLEPVDASRGPLRRPTELIQGGDEFGAELPRVLSRIPRALQLTGALDLNHSVERQHMWNMWGCQERKGLFVLHTRS